MSKKPPSLSVVVESEQEIDLRDPAIAAFLAWLLPGLGHFYQRRYAKALLFFICILGTFLFGVYLSSDAEVGWGRAVYVSWRPTDKRYPYLAQAFVGAPAFPALLQAMRVKGGKPPVLNGFMAPPTMEPKQGQVTVDAVHRRLGRYFELGTVYTMIAGLLNILAIFDAWGGPVFPEPEEEGKKEEEPGGTDEKDEADETADEEEVVDPQTARTPLD